MWIAYDAPTNRVNLQLYSLEKKSSRRSEHFIKKIYFVFQFYLMPRTNAHAVLLLWTCKMDKMPWNMKTIFRFISKLFEWKKTANCHRTLFSSLWSLAHKYIFFIIFHFSFLLRLMRILFHVICYFPSFPSKTVVSIVTAKLRTDKHTNIPYPHAQRMH